MKKVKTIITIILVICFFFVFVKTIPITKVVDENPWLKKDRPLISAHRGGSNINPENTEKAFDYVIKETNYVDVVEIDVRLTKDSVIVINHNSSINSLALEDNQDKVLIEDNSFEKLQQYNLGRNFIDKNTGHKPYENYSIEEAKKEGLTIMSLTNFFKKYHKVRDIKLLLEIKESNDKGFMIVDEIEKLFQNEAYKWWKDRTMFISFNDEVIDYSLKKYPNQFVGILGNNATKEIVFHKLGLDPLYSNLYHSIQIPTNYKIKKVNVNLLTKDIIKMAHKRNQSIVYWTINDEKEMKKIISYGADIITTDSPDVLWNIINN